jgi:hypothetical protein
MRTQIASEVDPFIGRVLDRHFFRPGCERKRVDSLHTEIDSPHPKRECQLVAWLAELRHGHGDRESLTQWIFDGILVFADQLNSRVDAPRLGRNMARCVPKLTGFA